MKFISKLPQLMKAKDPKLSQNKLAKDTGLGITTVNRIFNNDFSRIDTSTVKTLCKYFGCNVQDLFEVAE